MKFILPALLLLSLSAFSQTSVKGKQAVTSANTYGYVDGIRLDSIDASYGEFSWRLFRGGLTFDYGQSGEKRSKMVVTNKDGKQLAFDPDTIAMILNFFSFNGWELAHVYNSTTGGVDTFILKRKKMQ